MRELATSLGGEEIIPYAWQAAIPDPVAFLRAVVPVLDDRLARSAFAGWSETLTISWFFGAATLTIEDGAVVSVDSANEPGESVVKLPPDALTAWLLGCRSLAELRTIYPDVSCPREQRWLADTLFPTRYGFLSPVI